jgi:hypothetical protein
MDRPILHSIIVLACTGPCLGAVLVQDDFSSTSGALSGTMPDIGPGSSWFANSGYTFTAAGKITNSSGGANLGATIDMGSSGYFASNPGVYTLSMDVAFPADATGTAVYGVGFGAAASMTGGQSFANSGYYGAPWIFMRADGRVQVRSNGTNLLANELGGFTIGSTYNLKLVLDTSEAIWKLEAYVGGTQLDLNGANTGLVYSFNDSTKLENIRYVGIAATQTGSVGTMDIFSSPVRNRSQNPRTPCSPDSESQAWLCHADAGADP